MSGVDMLMESAVKLLIAKLPPEAIENVTKVSQYMLQAKEQLDRIEAGQTLLLKHQCEMRKLLIALIEQLQHRSLPNGDRREAVDATRNDGRD